MYYRYLSSGSGRVPVDLDGSYSGSLFIAGGAPSLANENLDRLKQPGINLMAINNTASLFQDAVTFWIGGDKPACYSERILLDSKILKFAIISRKDESVNGCAWRQLSSTFFFGTKENFTEDGFLRADRDFVWWKNTFFIALQLAYRLGFRKVYLIGCGFKVNNEKQYAYDVQLSEAEVDWNKRLYDKTAERMVRMKPTFDEAGFEIISATPDGALNEEYPVMTFDEAVDDALKDFPSDYEMEKCVHSSALKQENKDG